MAARKAHLTQAPRGAPPGEAPRVALAAAEARYVDALQPWFTSTWLEMFGTRAGEVSNPPTAAAWLGRVEDGISSRLVVRNGAPIGFLSFRVEPARLLLIELAIAPGERNRGYGAEAVYTAEESVGRVDQVHARFPAGNGLALYFWLRIGYCPLLPAGSADPNTMTVQRKS